MNRRCFWFVSGFTLKQWCEKHDLEPYTRPCSACERPLTTTLPFAVGQLRGLAAPVCECGNENTPYCVVRDAKYGDLFTGGRLK